METGIPPSQWEREGSRAVVTAVKILEEKEKSARRGARSTSDPGAGGPSSPQLSG